LAGLRAELDDDPALLEVSTNVLDGRKVALSELENVCESLPFLTSHRLVIAEGLVRRLSGSQRTQAGSKATERANQAAEDSVGAESERFLEYLERIPETTELVLVEEEVVRGALLRRLMGTAPGRPASCSATNRDRMICRAGFVGGETARSNRGRLSRIWRVRRRRLRQLDQGDQAGRLRLAGRETPMCACSSLPRAPTSSNW
jgi:hypothetical protein